MAAAEAEVAAAAAAAPAAAEGGKGAEGGKEAKGSGKKESKAAKAVATGKGGGDAAGGDGPSRAALHHRMFALLLRYKSLHGHGFQAALGPKVRERSATQAQRHAPSLRQGAAPRRACRACPRASAAADPPLACPLGACLPLDAQVWQLLQGRLGVAFECFASPLNAYLPAFCSGFPDVDAPFGSSGSFFNFAPLGGSYAVK